MYGLTTLETGIDPARLATIISYSWCCSEMPGAFAEFGVMKGGSLDLLANVHPLRKIYGIDGFEGLPAPSAVDLHTMGEFALSSFEFLQLEICLSVHKNVNILKGYSPEVFKQIPAYETFAFVHIDVDLYQSVKDGLDYFYPRLLPAGVMLFDDYGFESTPGAKIAVDEWQEPCSYRGLINIQGKGNTNQYVIIK